MAFKLGYRPLPGIAHGGNIKNKFKFKIEHANLKDGIVAEAVSEDKIRIDKDVDKDSKLYKEALAHEAVHCKEMSEGRIAYGDDWVRSDGKTYPRKGGKIKWTDGEWYDEGHDIFPWEQRAMNAENHV